MRSKFRRQGSCRLQSYPLEAVARRVRAHCQRASSLRFAHVRAQGSSRKRNTSSKAPLSAHQRTGAGCWQRVPERFVAAFSLLAHLLARRGLASVNRAELPYGGVGSLVAQSSERRASRFSLRRSCHCHFVLSSSCDESAEVRPLLEPCNPRERSSGFAIAYSWDAVLTGR